MNIGDILNIIVAILLFLITIRNIFTDYTRWDKSRYKFIRFIFAKSEKITADRILEELGYAVNETALFRKNARKQKEQDILNQLVNILKESILKSQDSNVKFGTAHNSLYYVDTMGASHDENTCNTMNKLLWQLIRKNHTNIDFIFALKESNSNLAASFDKAHDNIFSIIVKNNTDKSYVRGGNLEIQARINFEGFHILEKKAEEAFYKKRDLTGIAIACNLSNGSSMLDSILNFNDLCRQMNESGKQLSKIKPIKEVYILYRAIDTPDLDKKFEAQEIKCYRFFDLNEKKKEELYNMKNNEVKTSDFSCIKCISQKKARCKAIHCWKHLK